MSNRIPKLPAIRGLGAAALACLVVAAGAAPAAAIEPLGQFGLGEGDQAGLLDSSSGVAVDPAGRVYVSEAANNRISVFSPEGTFLRAFGNDVVPGGRGQFGEGFEQCTTVCKAGVAGGGPGELTAPTRIAADADGSVYVVEGRANPRISVFDAAGRFRRAFGRDVDAANAGTGFEVCTSKCQAATPGARSGELADATGIAIDSAGVVWVSDRLNNRVAAYTVDGTFLRAFGKQVNRLLGRRRDVCTTHCKPGLRGNGAGFLTLPTGVNADAAGNVYVTHEGSVSVLSPEGDFLRAFGKDVVPDNAETGFEVCTTICKSAEEGDGRGEFFGAQSLVFDAAGRIYISDQVNHRVQIFSRGESFLRAFGTDVVPANAQTGFEVCTTQCQRGAQGLAPGQIASPTQVALDCHGTLYVAEPSNSRVERFGEPGTASSPCVDPRVLTSGFGVMRVKRQLRSGTATLIVSVPRRARVHVKGSRIRPALEQATGASTVRLAVRPTRATMRRLDRRGTALVRANVTYTPRNGVRHTKTRLILLSKRGAR